MKPSILIIDDEEAICISLKNSLGSDYEVAHAVTKAEALHKVKENTFQLALLDVYLGNDDGISLLEELKKIDPDLVVIVMTAHGSIRSCVTAMKSGAFTYMTKPLDLEALGIFLRQGLEYRWKNEKVASLSEEMRIRNRYGEMIGKSPAMQEVYNMVERLKDLDAPVVVEGESGTGKELVVRALHYLGNRKNEKFVEINCVAIPEGLLEMEFFGYRRGAFTGAVSDKKGKFEAADKGTILLDEIGDMPMALQGKLLRVLQEKRFTPLGSNESKAIDVRVIAATNHDLWQMVQQGTFRQDLYYRLNVINIRLPLLRDRKQDIPLLISQFIEECNREYGKNIHGITKEAERILLSHDYPGNVRELKNIIEFASIMCAQEYIQASDLPKQLLSKPGGAVQIPQETDRVPKGTLREIERMAILEALERNNGNQRRTAKELGISERSLYNKLKEYDYEKPDRSGHSM